MNSNVLIHSSAFKCQMGLVVYDVIKCILWTSKTFSDMVLKLSFRMLKVNHIFSLLFSSINVHGVYCIKLKYKSNFFTTNSFTFPYILVLHRRIFIMLLYIKIFFFNYFNLIMKLQQFLHRLLSLQIKLVKWLIMTLVSHKVNRYRITF